jgi:hypothetical protein
VHISWRLKWKENGGPEGRQPIPPHCGQQPRANLEKAADPPSSGFVPFAGPDGSIGERAKRRKVWQIERCVISTFRIAESMASRATFANGSTCCGLENYGFLRVGKSCKRN